MDLFCFASRSEENIWLGVKASLWAVATVSPSQMASRRSKAAKYMMPGSKGMFYCNPRHAFTTPFIVESRADPVAVVRDVWTEHWELPFKIRPLGDPTRFLAMNDAWEHWPVLRKRIDRRGGVSAAMNITGTTVFVPVEISDEDWSIILKDLAV